MTAVRIEPVRSRSQREAFLRVPWAIYREYPAWVPPLLMDQRTLIDPAKGTFFRDSAGDFFVALRDGKVVGRIAAFENSHHLAAHADGAGFFGFFESPDDAGVAEPLLRTAEDWLRARGLRVARGPANFSIYEEAGVLVHGFEHQPMMGMAYTPPYYPRLLEGAGYRKAKDLFVYRLSRESARWDRIERIAEVAGRVSGLRVRNLDMSRLREEANFLETVYADAWRDNWGQVPISAAEFYEQYQKYRMFVQPELVYLADVDGDPAGFFIAMPDMNELLKPMNGRLLSPGLFRLLFRRKSVRRYRLFMMGVRTKYRRLGLPLVFLNRCRQVLEPRQPELLECSWILEDNHEVIAMLERMGAEKAQTLRLYEKELT